MSAKHIFDSGEGLVVKSLRGAVWLNPALRLHPASKSVYTASQSPTSQVAVISGGGAGHEPAHASYTGRGMLAASVSGDIFASPSTNQIMNTIKFAALRRESSAEAVKDVLVIINNYTGDRLNFGLAIEKARVLFPRMRLESVVVADDVSLLGAGENAALVGPRGLAGNILVCKLLGALAERGEGLSGMKRFGDAVVANLASVGVALEHCHVPGRTREGGVLRETEYELGLGLHNEPGVMKKTMEGPQQLVAEMISLILGRANRQVGSTGSGATFLGKVSTEGQDEVVLFVNNLGGMSQLEMGAVLDEIVSQLAELGVHSVRVYLSSYMTSLNAPGFSISLLSTTGIKRILEGSGAIEHIKVVELLDDPTEAAAWVGVRSHWPTQVRNQSQEEREADRLCASLGSNVRSTDADAHDTFDWWDASGVSRSVVTDAIRGACESVLRVQDELTMFDTVVGDGDCGESFSAGAKAILMRIDNGEIMVLESSQAAFVKSVGETLEDSMGGTIGALFGIFFAALSASLQDLSLISWPSALESALGALSKHTPARPGDRTVIDALFPFCSALSMGHDIDKAAEAAREGAESTRGMRARLGRASYVVRQEQGDLPPDPGAWGVAAIAKGFVDGLRGRTRHT